MAVYPSASDLVAGRGAGEDRIVVLRGRQSDAAEVLLRSAYTYRDGGSAWDAFPEEWRRAGREKARAALADFRNSIGDYPSKADLATVEASVVCTYGARSPHNMFRFACSLASAIPTASTHQIEGAGHAAPFDATANFVQLIADTITSSDRDSPPAAARPFEDMIKGRGFRSCPRYLKGPTEPGPGAVGIAAKSCCAH